MKTVQNITISNFLLQSGEVCRINLSFQTFGLPIGMAPIVIVNHALTGNSNVAGENGWWKEVVGENKVIDPQKFTIIAFNIPGNGYDEIPENLIENYKSFTTKDIASLFWKGLEYLKIEQLFAVIGGSLGGAIAWEMAFIKPKSIQNLIPIATNWKANDWLIGNVLVQDAILNHSINPIHDARLHAMLLYRTPESLTAKFNSEKNGNQDSYKVESWLLHHGEKLAGRFQLSAYKLMNHLLKTIGESYSEKDLQNFILSSNTKIHQIAINSDYFFAPNENIKTHNLLSNLTKNITYHEINSIHGHDAFLIEYERLNYILKTIINAKHTT
ncbi:alpha/beta fold hydrolase [Flavobacterium difficile]|uniref:Alpha/beta fold hydrolase n=1 Tax=Flavobacterium difficile TaxID=2709659 RepID=A0ABX0I3T3_9FLAO|nr:alpha/beta fold hydrolase [Flavobacterium difficile]NHM00725.1 alpha/beta fold hydrolase [Flavobacterium difficile]